MDNILMMYYLRDLYHYDICKINIEQKDVFIWIYKTKIHIFASWIINKRFIYFNKQRD